MLHRFGGNFAAGKHLLDEVNAPTRAVEFIAKQDVRRAGRSAKSAVGAGPQHFFGLRDVGIGKLLLREIGSHRFNPLRPSAQD